MCDEAGVRLDCDLGLGCLASQHSFRGSGSLKGEVGELLGGHVAKVWVRERIVRPVRRL